jgi:AraC-like DNA-binding protein
MLLMATIPSCDTEPTAPVAALDDTKETNRHVRRRRRVRLSYPAPLMQLAVSLQRSIGVRRAAGLLGLQLSTIYRWIGRDNAIYRHVPPNPSSPCLPDLVARCRDLGFPIDGSTFLHSAEVAESTRETARHCAMRVDEDPPMLREIAISNPSCNRTRDKVMAVKALLDQRFAEPWTCSRLAGCCGLSRLHFIHVFARHVGVPPYQYLTRVRVERARELSMQLDRPLQAIARDVGFGSTSSLHRAFHRYLGASAGELFNCVGRC